MISVHFQGKPFNITGIQIYAQTSNAEEAEVEQLNTNTKKRYPFHYRGLECKSRKSKDAWSNKQIWPCSTEWSRTKTKSFVKTTHWPQQTPSSDNTRENFTHGHHQVVNTTIRLVIVFSVKDGEALYSQQKQDWKLPVAQIMKFLLPNSDLSLRK